ncbi:MULTISPECIES: hypothetical protein [unclassified Arthrobacter]|uniref:hypothetical protein n=1 Tax=unclassified Arthrobacter TaxID=235627 RepID=UPI00159D2399|nr:MULTISPECIES: hypothetical protein [unclassified Arthrobacter]MCQ9164899.1 hypothetical protein [Arthrobacter sp. STN4]NVM98196.1 hypothetical protein [Arthrobacter sp. SDTb3-6]
MGDRGARLARGWTAAAFATLAAVLSHIWGGGDAPQPLLVLFSLAISGLVCVFLAGRVLSLTNLVAAVVASEGLFHLLFSLSADTPASLPAAAMAAAHRGMDMGGMDMGGMDMGGTLAAPSPMAVGPAADMAAGHTPAMWFSHAAAAGLTIVFLRYGEASAIRLLESLRLRITAIIGLAIVPIPAPLRIDAAPEPWLPAASALDVPLPVRHHRGPPALAAAA